MTVAFTANQNYSYYQCSTCASIRYLVLKAKIIGTSAAALQPRIDSQSSWFQISHLNLLRQRCKHYLADSSCLIN